MATYGSINPNTGGFTPTNTAAKPLTVSGSNGGKVLNNPPAATPLSLVGLKANNPMNNVKAPNTTLPANQVAPKDLSSTYANVGGTIYNKASNSKFSNPADFFKDSGQTSFDNIKFDQGYKPSGSETIYGQPATNPQVQTQSGANSSNTGGITLNSQQPQLNSGTPYKTDTQAGANPTYPGIVGGLLNKASTPNPDYTAAQQQITNLGQQQSALQGELARQTANIHGSPIDLSLATGQQGILNQLFASKQAALAPQYSAAVAQLGAANTQQQLQQQGFTSAAQLTQPVGQFGMLTNPLTGTPLNTQVFSGAIQQAQQLVNSGTPADSQAVQSLLSPFGFVGQLAFNNAMQAAQGGGWNPAAQSAATGQNITFGQQTQAGAQNVNLALQQVGTLNPLITNFMSTAGINPNDNAKLNEQISTYMNTISDPGAIAQYNTLINELQRFSSQLIGTGSLTPSGVTQATQLQSPQNLSVNQIKSYLQTLSDAGNNQLYNLQQQSSQAYGGNNGAYTGAPAAPVTNTTPAPPATLGGSTTHLGQAAGGAGINLIGALANDIKNLGGEIIGWIAKGFAG